VQADAAPVAADLPPLQQTGLLETCDELRHPGDGHALTGSELPHADAGGLLDLDEQRDLAAGHSEGVDLAAQLPVELQQNRAQLIRQHGGVDSGGQHFVNQVN
jgi:hypothetical protein